MYADGLLWGLSCGTAGLGTQGGGDTTGPTGQMLDRPAARSGTVSVPVSSSCFVIITFFWFDLYLGGFLAFS